MVDSMMSPAATPTWFVAMPDRDDAGWIARQEHLPRQTQLVCHASGRPWLVGHWQSGNVHEVTAGRTRIVVVGRCIIDADQLHAHMERAASTKDYERLTRFPGSYYVLVAADDGMRLFGDTVGLCRLCSTVVESVPIVSNRSDLLARLARATISDRWLARALAFPAEPPPLADETPWSGVRAIPPGQHLTIDPEMRMQAHTHWHPPPATRSLREGASALTAALTDAVDGRLRHVSRASCDLSGGKDSTTLSLLSHQAATESSTLLLAVTMPGIAPDNDDQHWARQAAKYMPHAHYVEVAERDCPLPYQDLDLAQPWTDEPSAFSMHSARYRHLAERVRSHGTEVHLTGHGGDDVLEAPLAYLRDSLRRRPLRAVMHARGHAGLTGNGLSSYLADMLFPGRYDAWLRHLARHLHPQRQRKTGSGTAATGWTDLPTVPPWMTKDAAASLGNDLRRASREATHLTATRGQFAALCRVRAIARMARLHQQFMGQLGVRVELPFLDRPVVEACLSVRGDERTNPWQYKPLLDAAMADIMPKPLLDRDNKAHYTEDTMAGLRRQTHLLIDMFADSALGRRGLIDTNRLRDSLTRGAWERLPLGPITTTLAVELWLRNAENMFT
jgi:asparagine synthase (glutamine-hydrolysing)